MADTTTIKERVASLERQIPEIYKTLGTMDTRTNHISDDTAAIKRSIYGFDTTAGLLHSVKVLEDKMDDIKKLVWVVIGLIVAIATGGVYQAIVHAATAIK